KKATKITYKEHQAFSFLIDSRDNNYFCRYSPASDRFEIERITASWDILLAYFKDWLNNLSQETSHDDKWKKLEEEINNFDFKFEGTNDQFSVLEYEEVCLKIDVIKDKITLINLPDEQLTKIHADLEYLKEKAKVLGKLDWKTLFVGTIVNFITQYSLPPEKINSLINLIKEVMNQLLLN